MNVVVAFAGTGWITTNKTIIAADSAHAIRTRGSTRAHANCIVEMTDRNFWAVIVPGDASAAKPGLFTDLRVAKPDSRADLRLAPDRRRSLAQTRGPDLVAQCCDRLRGLWIAIFL